MFQPLKKYADFQGRARRSEFWLFALFVFIVEAVFIVLLAATGGFDTPRPGATAGLVNLLFGLFALGIFIPNLALTFRRLHDINRSAWWIFISLIPLVGAITLFVFYLLPGTPGPNRFGPDPKVTLKDTAETFA
jgi:uncharacterized membrane protein YhaH (DUF805 family)